MDIYLIECRSGCSCCSDQNHYRGPYKTKEEAEKRIEYFSCENAHNNPVASQYARKGRYYISKYEAEEIGGNRVIVSDKVFDWNGFIELNEDGSIKGDYDSDWFTSDLY